MRISEKIDKIVKAIVHFQNEVENPKKSTKAYNYKYATLDQVLDTVKPTLKKNGLAVNQSVGNEGDKITVKTIIWHESGQFIQSDSLALPLDDGQSRSDVQSAGSSITYARRYSLSAALGIASEEDTDGKKSNNSKSKSSNKTKNKTSNIDKQRKKIVAEYYGEDGQFKKDVNSVISGYMAEKKKKKLIQLTEKQFTKLCQEIEKDLLTNEETDELPF